MKQLTVILACAFLVVVSCNHRRGGSGGRGGGLGGRGGGFGGRGEGFGSRGEGFGGREGSGGRGEGPARILDNLFEGRRELDREIRREEDVIGRQVGRQIEREVERNLGPEGREVVEEAARQILRDSNQGDDY